MRHAHSAQKNDDQHNGRRTCRWRDHEFTASRGDASDETGRLSKYALPSDDADPSTIDEIGGKEERHWSLVAHAKG